MTGAGGWPLNVFLTPEQVPFYAGTYFPPESRMGMPSWRDVLEAVAEAWDETARRDPRRRRRGSPSACRAAPRCARPSEPLQAAAARRGGRGPARAVRPRPTAASAARPSSRPPRRSSSCCAAASTSMVAADPARDGLGRHVRPGRRRLRALLGRRLLARPALREDALRQRAARARVPARLAGDRRRRCSGASTEETLDWALREMRAPRGRLLLRARRRLRGRRGQVLRLERRRAARGARRRARRRRGDRLVRRHRPRQLRGRQHPGARPGRPGAAATTGARASTRCARSASGPGSTTSA